MYRLTNKTIFIISQQKWGNMRVSKHHYAIQLSKNGNRVFFIDPPDLSLKENFLNTEIIEYPGLHTVSYRPFFRGKRFLPRFIFKQLLRHQITIFKRRLQVIPDVVINFYPFCFENLKWFGARHAIFFAADLYKPGTVPGEAVTAGFCLGVSQSIVSLLQRSNPHSYFINHGLNAEFAALAKKRLTTLNSGIPETKKVFTVGYIGNLLMEAPDRIVMKQIISSHPSLKFIFWGQYEKGQDNMVAYEQKEVFDFIEFLKDCPNAELRGPKAQNILVTEIEPVDLFWMCYDLNRTWLWDGSNSHKILEYLATGQPGVTHHIDTYKNNDLLYMLNDTDNKAYPDLFASVIKKIENGEDEPLKKKRLQFALSNTYEKQIEYIEELINEN